MTKKIVIHLQKINRYGRREKVATDEGGGADNADIMGSA